MVEPAPRYEDIEIPLRDPVHGLDRVTGVLGIPEWWPTGSRVSVVIAHGNQADDPQLEFLQQQLTERKLLTLRFRFPFVEAGKKRPDEPLVMTRTFAAAVAALSRDPTSAPAHIFIGGKGQGALGAAHAGTGRLHVDGVFFLGYPLHKQGDTEELRSDRLFRLVAPLLFLTGDRDRFCDLDALRRTTLRIGAQTDIHILREADQAFKVLKKSDRTEEDVLQEMLSTLEAWIARTLGE